MKKILSLAVLFIMFTSVFSIENPSVKELTNPMQVEFMLEDEDPVDDIPFISIFELEDEKYVDDIPFNTLHIAMQSVEYWKTRDIEITEIIEIEDIDYIRFNIQNIFFEISIDFLENLINVKY